MRNIYELPKVQEDSASSLRTLIESFWQDYRAPQALNQPVEHWDLFLTHHLASKLDPESRKEIEQKSPLDKIPPIRDFIEILSTRLRVLEAITLNQPSGQPLKQQRATNLPATDKARRSLVTSSPVCSICKQSHSIFKCLTLAAMTIDDRQALVKRLNLCSNCLNPRHGSKLCIYGSCRVCHRKHHTLLHQYSPHSHNSSQQPTKSIPLTDAGSSPNTTQASAELSQTSLSVSAVSNVTKQRTSSQVILATAIVNICDASGRVHQCRALLDSGSMSNFITEQTAQRLRLHRNRTRVPINGIGDKGHIVKYAATANVQSRLSAFNLNVTCLIMPKITGKLPLYEIDFNRYTIPEKIKQQLADPLFCYPEDIDMLIGAEFYNDIVHGEKLNINENLPTLVSSAFGYLIMGSVYSIQNTRPLTALVCSMDELNDQIKKFWELESVNAVGNLTAEEKECEQLFKETTTRSSDGRYIVTLPVAA